MGSKVKKFKFIRHRITKKDTRPKLKTTTETEELILTDTQTRL